MSDVIELLEALVRINSVNPMLDPNGPGEAKCAAFVKDWCEAHGLETHIVMSDGRPNVIAVVRGTGGGKSLILSGHLDTVGVTGMEAPFSPHTENGRMYGRGTADMKAGVAAMMVAAANAAKMNLRGNVIVTAVADEEAYSIGTSAVLDSGLRADAAIVTEPSNGNIVIAHKGFAWAEITFSGRAAHGSQPENGIDAIVHAGRFLVGLQALQDRLQAGPGHSLLGKGSVHASTIAGGTEWATYPAECVLRIERRTVPGETRAYFIEELEQIAAECRTNIPQFAAEIRLDWSRGTFHIDPEHPLVELAQRKVVERIGSTELTGKAGWMDACLLSEAGIPTVVFGPTGAGHHGTGEWVDVASVESSAEVITEIIREFCA